MPSSIFKKLRNGELVPTTISLELAGHSIKHPLGVVENILVKIGTLYFPTDFYVLDTDNAFEPPLILGKHF